MMLVLVLVALLSFSVVFGFKKAVIVVAVISLLYLAVIIFAIIEKKHNEKTAKLPRDPMQASLDAVLRNGFGAFPLYREKVAKLESGYGKESEDRKTPKPEDGYDDEEEYLLWYDHYHNHHRDENEHHDPHYCGSDDCECHPHYDDYDDDDGDDSADVDDLNTL